MADWKGIVGKGFTANSFKTYVNGLALETWKPSFIVLHNTSVPTVADWVKVAGEQRMKNLEHYYRDEQKWSAGPHLFVAPDKIWVFTPLTTSGVHSPSWNAVSWGIEMVGDYQKEALNVDVMNNTVAAIAALSKFGSLDPSTLRLHKEDPKTTHKTCPGKNVVKQDVINAVSAKLKAPAAEPGEHLVSRNGVIRSTNSNTQ